MTLNLKVLAIYKEDENMNAAVKLLENKGCDVFAETSVFQAIATSTENRVDIIVLDIDDLELKEIEFIDVVRKINPNLFILISFSNPNRERAFKFIDRGADCYILKPFYINELFAIIRNFSNRISSDEKVTKKLHETHKSIEHLALRIAHEINNPLTTITGQIQLRLSQLEGSEPDFKLFTILEEETQRICEAARDLATYAQLRSPDKQFVNLNDILKDVISFYKDTLQEEDIQVVQTFDEDLPMIMADIEQITLVCKNIINNSRRAISGKGDLIITTKRGLDNYVITTFYDTGRGINPDEIKSIFDPFFVINEEERGMGLGLCVSNEIIKKHGGTLTVESQIDRGSTFQFALPIDTD
ncbi:MAG: ATP-binding protein [Planctomycetota bacterium]|jgi:signal transduction histidine kinase